MNEECAMLKLDFSVSQPGFSLNVDTTLSHKVTGLCGASGAGKTTMLKALTGIHSSTYGTIVFQDQTWLETSRGKYLVPELRGVGYVPQDLLLFPHLSVRKNLEFGRSRAQDSDQDFETMFRSVVDMLELDPLLDRNINEVSGGEGQRIALGRALCSSPQLLLLDEPMSSLDDQLKYRIIPFLLRIKNELKIPIILSSHNYSEIQALCDELLFIENGTISFQGTLNEFSTQILINKTATEYSNSFVGRLVAQESYHSVVNVGGKKEVLWCVPKCRAPIDSDVVLSLDASQIIIAKNQVEAVSARNQFPVVIHSISQFKSNKLLRAEVPNTSIALNVEISREAEEELRLVPGMTVFAVFKSNAVRVCE